MDRKQLNGQDSHENHDLILQSRQPHALSVHQDVMAPPRTESDDLSVVMQFVRLLWKRKRVLVFTCLIGAIAATAVTLYQRPIYVAAVSMQIDNLQEPFGSRLIASSPALQTQIQLLLSQNLRARASSKLRSKPPTQPPKVFAPLAGLRKMLGLKQHIESITWDRAVGWAAGSTTITNPRDSSVLRITTQSPNPQAASGFANTLAEEYILHNQEERWDSYQDMGAWMTRAQQELKEKVEQSDQRLAAFAKAKGLVFFGAQNVEEDKLKQLQAQLLQASADRITKMAVYESSKTGESQSLPAILDSGPMGVYQTKLTELRRELADLSTTLTPSHYKVQRIQAQIDEIEKQREKERSNILSRIRIEYESASKRENDLRRQYDGEAHALAGQADDLIQYNLLQREAESNKKLYETTLQKAKEASLASAMRASSARIVDPALAFAVPMSPNYIFNVTLGIFGGLLCGALFVFVRSRMDSTIQSPGVLELQMNLRELGVIPAATLDPALRGGLSALPRALGTGKRSRGRTKLAGGDDGSDCLELVTWNRKPSLLAEAFRSTITSILYTGDNGSRPRVFVITSPAPQEGKSTVVSNLAIALAEVSNRVLLIDADMRRPRLHSIFDLPNTFGLADVLHERKPVQEYVIDSIVRKTLVPNLYVLPAGPARTNLSRLLYSKRMKEMITRFRDKFDVILIDTAPVLVVPDSRILARTADGVILVLRAHKTHQEAAFAAAKCFAEDGNRIIGTILNGWNPKMSSDGYYGSYETYYSPYFQMDDH
jgi:succinoglycan biosynthesis transport protein ExoP